MRNQEIAKILRGMSDTLEIQGGNPFRIRAYQKAAQNVENLAQDIAEVAGRGELEKIPGIGKDMAVKIKEILETGTLKQLEDLKREIPEGVVALLSIPGLGPKTAKLLFEELGIKDVDELERMAREHRLQGLPGIKAKTEENICKGIEVLRKGQERIPLGTVMPLSEEICHRLKAAAPVTRITVAGSVRRQRETIRDIDILVVSPDPEKVMEKFVTLQQVGEVLAKGATKSSVRTREGIQIDLRVVEPESFGAALCYFTGSKAHNIRIRDRAVRMGLKVNEYGVFRDETWIAGREEDEVYRAVALPFIPPELREDRGEVEAAQQGTLPRLVERSEIQGDLHVHSKYSDGTATAGEIAKKAMQMGLHWVGICDHSPSLRIARGTRVDTLKRKVEELRRWNEREGVVRLLCGTEVDILSDGRLDYPDDVLAELDLVIAAIHSGFKQDEKIMTQRLISAMENPHVHGIAHPTGRVFGEREGYRVDLESVLEAARRTGTFLEINAYPKRLDLNDIASRSAKEKGVLLGIGTDAHILDQMEYLDLGLAVARRGWLEKRDLLNTLPYHELIAWLKQR
jgi:DNA polymerase (family 10)